MWDAFSQKKSVVTRLDGLMFCLGAYFAYYYKDL